MCGCSKSVKSIKGIQMKKFLKFKKIKSVKSKDAMDTGLQLLLVVSIFAIARLIKKFSWYTKLSASTQSYVDWGAILAGAGLHLLAEHPYIKSVGLAAALAGIYNKYGDEVDAQVKKIFNIAGWDRSLLDDPQRGVPRVAGKAPKVACPPQQGF